MANITIRNIPDSVFEKLPEMQIELWQEMSGKWKDKKSKKRQSQAL